MGKSPNGRPLGWMMPTKPAAVFIRFSWPYAAASTARRTPLSRESSHSHGQYARLSAASCSLSAMLCVHTTELAGRVAPLGTPHGATGAVTPAIPFLALGRINTSTPSPSGMTPLARSLSTHPL